MARATLFPEARAARVGPRPIDPVIAFRTKSQVSDAICSEAWAPSITLTPDIALFNSSAPLLTPTMGTLKSLTCLANNVKLFPPALRPTTLKSSGFAAITSKA